jgi:hypothetical protein
MRSGSGKDFPGEIVVDPFAGTGTTCVAAKRMGLRWIGIDRVAKYVAMARVNVEQAAIDGGPDLRVGFLKWPRVVEEAMPRRSAARPEKRNISVRPTGWRERARER